MRIHLTKGAIALLSLCALAAGAAEAKDATLIIDASESMRGFFRQSELTKWLDEVRAIAGAAGTELDERLMVSSGPNKATYPDLSSWLSNPVYGGYSPLQTAIEENFSKSKSLFLVTDNVQTSGAGDSEAFYGFFRRPEVGYVYVTPMQFPFEGTLYFSRNGQTPAGLLGALRRDTPGGEFDKAGDNGKNLQVHYKGKRGLVFYAISKADENPEAFFAMLRRLKEGSAKDVLLIKPIDGRQFEVDGVESLAEVTAARRAFPAPSDRNSPELIEPTLRIWKTESSSERSAVMAPFDALHRPSFQMNRSNQAVFYFGLRSRLDHVVIGDRVNPWNNPVTLELSPPEVRLGNSRVFQAGTRGDVSPSRLVGSLSAIAADGSPRYIYMGRVQFGPFRDTWDWSSPATWLQNIDAVPAHLQFQVRLKVPSNSLTLNQDFASRYFSRSLTAADRIFAPTDIVQYLASGVTDIPLSIHMDEAKIPAKPGAEPSIIWRFTVPPNGGPLMLLAALLMSLLTLLAWGLRTLMKPYRWTWRDGLTHQVSRAGINSSGHGLSQDGAVYAILKGEGLSMYVKPAEGYAWDDASTGAKPFSPGKTYEIYSGPEHVETLHIK